MTIIINKNRNRYRRTLGYIRFILFQSLQQFQQYLPDVIDGFHFHALAGRMGLYDAGTYAGHLDAWIVLYEETSLKHEVHGHHTGTPTQYVKEGIAGELQEGRVLVFLPSRC